MLRSHWAVIRFLRAVQEVFLNKHSLTEADLYEPPLTVFGDSAVERYFTPGRDRRNSETHRESRGLTRRFRLTRC